VFEVRERVSGKCRVGLKRRELWGRCIHLRTNIIATAILIKKLKI